MAERAALKKGVLYILLSAFSFALMSVFIREVGDLPAAQKALFRNSVSFLFAAVMIRRGRSDNRDKVKHNWRQLLLRSVAFVLGISFVYLALALAASSMGQFLRDYGKTIQRIGGVIVILLGIFQLATKLFGHNMGRERRLSFNLDKYRMNPLVAFILGFTFSFAWTPCVGPILLSVIAMVANAGTISKGLLLMLLYTLAFTIPFLLVGIFTTKVLEFFRKRRKVMQYTVIVGAVLMIIMGALMVFDIQGVFNIS